MVIVGAGASFGQHSQNPPPLGKDLAAAIREVDARFPEIESRTGKKCGDDFEQWLLQISDEPRAFTESLAVVAHFFRQYKEVKDDSLYYSLLSALGEKGISSSCFLSLNYESLLEMALQKKVYRLDWGSSAIRNDSFNTSGLAKQSVPFYKPHGSAHFMTCLANGPAVPGATTLDLTSKIHMETEVLHPARSNPGSSALSVISAYEPQKRSPFNSTFVEEIRQSAEMAASNTRVAIIIGVRFAPNDAFLPRLLDCIVKKEAKIEHVGGNEDFTAYKQRYSSNKVTVNHMSKRFDNECLNKIQKLVCSID